jgi:cytochrome c553
MKLIIKATSHLVILTIVFAATARAHAVSKENFEAKMGYCQDCHGPSGQGYRGFYPIPRLAGQQTEYLENQLRAFVEHRRTNNIMFNVGHFNPRPLGGAPKNLVAAGKKIFEDGVPDANIVACAACHGPDATGKDEFPRLAGQLYPYVVKTLSNWGKERGQIPGKPDTSAVMQPVVHSLTKSQIEAVAAYVSYLK